MRNAKAKSTPPEKWELCTPILNPKGCPEPGWYLFVMNRDGEPRSLGPFATKKQCAGMMAQPCGAKGCKGLVWFDPTDKIDAERAEAARAAGGGKVLCTECNDEFVEWHKKTHGKPPTPAGVQ